LRFGKKLNSTVVKIILKYSEFQLDRAQKVQAISVSAKRLPLIRLPPIFNRLPPIFNRLPPIFNRLPPIFNRLPPIFNRLPPIFNRLPPIFNRLPQTLNRLPQMSRKSLNHLPLNSVVMHQTTIMSAKSLPLSALKGQT
jgi:hypothetical protein